MKKRLLIFMVLLAAIVTGAGAQSTTLSISDGTYYLYNPYSGKFLSRGGAYGTQAVADDYGFPINVTSDSEGAYTLTNYDGAGSYGDDYWLYADCSGTRIRTYTLEAVGDGYYLHNTNRNTDDNRMFVYMADDTDKYSVCGNATVGVNVETLEQAVWQFLTPAQRDEKVSANKAAAEEAAISTAGLTSKRLMTIGTPTVLTFKTGSAWTFTPKRYDSGAATNEYGTESYQGTGKFTQTIEGLESGLYKVSIQAFYRDGSNESMVDAYNEGYALGVAYMQVNNSKVRIKAWAEDRRSDNFSNSMADMEELFDEGRYISETYVYVDEDGYLNLTVAVPSYIASGWFVGNNVTYQKMAVSIGLPIDAAHFPDEGFRNWLKGRSYGADGYLTDEEIASVDEMYIGYFDVYDLTGIKYFTELKTLNAGWENMHLTTLDVSGMTKLERLYCEENELTSLNVSGCTSLKWLECYDNHLTTLDVSDCTNLLVLSCGKNQLTSLNLSGLTSLNSLDCENNQLTSLNVSGCTGLVYVSCYDNMLNQEAMGAFIDMLPTPVYHGGGGGSAAPRRASTERAGQLIAIDTESTTEQNVITNGQVILANDKNWTIYSTENGQTQTEIVAVVATTHDPEVVVNCDYYTWDKDGQTYTASGTYTYEAKDGEGNVTDIYTLELTIRNSSTSQLYESAIIGSHYTKHGFDFIVESTEKDYYYYTTNAAGCDSIVVLHIYPNTWDSVVAEYGFYDYYGGEHGCIYSPESTYFRLWAPLASKVSLKIYGTGSDNEEGAALLGTYKMDKLMDGDQWTGVWVPDWIDGDMKNKYYTYDVDGTEIADPWGYTTGLNGTRSMICDLDGTDPENWDSDSHRFYEQGNAVEYINVPEFSADEMCGVSEANRGKYLALTESGTTEGNEGEVPTCMSKLKEDGVKAIVLTMTSPQMIPDQYSNNPYDGNVVINEMKQVAQAVHNDFGMSLFVRFDFSTAPATVPVSDHYKYYILATCLHWVNEYHADGIVLAADIDAETKAAIREALDAIDTRIILATDEEIEAMQVSDGIREIDQSPNTAVRYYTVDGRSIQGKPTQKGIYVVKGKKVMK
ncbi:MAG: hypothetical protein IJK46_13225 [Prevotella sp.]|nr:hypothetical protein [Prevotella sp.]